METNARTEDTPSLYSWQVPGKPISVHLSHQVIDRILLEAVRGLGSIPRRGAEIGGLLLGTAQRGEKLVVKIEDHCPVPCQHSFGPSYVLTEEEKRAFEAALESWQPSPSRALYAVGYYRSHTRENLGMSEEDLGLFSTYFADPAKVALVIKPRATGSSGAGFFFWEKGEIRSQSTYLEFPFDRRELEAAEVPPAAAEVAAGDSEQLCEATPTVAEDIPLPSFLAASQRDPKERGLSSLRWRSWWVQIPIILALVLLGGWLGIQGGRYLKQQLPQAAPEDPYTLGLTVAEYGDNLHLTWNREAPAIRSARRGLLIIGDGDQSRVLEMDWNQLQNGSVMYRRMSGPVRFRLEVYLKENRVLSESWEAPSPPQPASSPQPQITSPRPQD
jgi:hypothetical protein